MSDAAAGGNAEVWRVHTPAVLGALLRRSGDFAACGDVVQEALLAASVQWPRDGLPDDPKAWLVRVAARRLIDGEARAPARLTPGGDLVPLSEQDRRMWRHTDIEHGAALGTRAIPWGPTGLFQLQAAIAAGRCEAAGQRAGVTGAAQ